MKLKFKIGQRRPLVDLSLKRLLLDPQNPRLPEEDQGKKPTELLGVMRRLFYLEELATSFAENAFFAEEPLIGIPIDAVDGSAPNRDAAALQALADDSDEQFVIVEGNRRLAALILLTDDRLRAQLGVEGWPDISEGLRDRLRMVPVILYPSRREVLPYLGVRHIAGIRKWDSFAKARYIAGMRKDGFSVADIDERIGGRGNSATKLYLCYRIIRTAGRKLGFDISVAKENFSYLLLAINQSPIKEYLGLEGGLDDINLDNPIDRRHLNNLRNLLSWLYGLGDKEAVVEESRDITRYLSPVLKSEEATRKLVETRDLKVAYEYSGGEEAMLLNLLADARRKVERAIPVVSKHKGGPVKAECGRLRDLVVRLAKGAGCEDA